MKRKYNKPRGTVLLSLLILATTHYQDAAYLPADTQPALYGSNLPLGGRWKTYPELWILIAVPGQRESQETSTVKSFQIKIGFDHF